MKYLSLEEILRLHFAVVEDFGGLHGVRAESRLQSAVATPKQVIFGQIHYKSVHQKAAVYLRNIIADHPFVDGNKRTAVTCTGIFLMRNNYPLNASSKELEDFAVRVAVEHLSVEEIAVWLKRRSKIKP